MYTRALLFQRIAGGSSAERGRSDAKISDAVSRTGFSLLHWQRRLKIKPTGVTGCGKTQNVVILSEAKNPSLFLLLYSNRREILRFAQNDRTRHFFRSLVSLSYR